MSADTKGKKKPPAHLHRVVEALKTHHLITDDLATGDSKYMGICVLPEDEAKKAGQDPPIHRRLDIRLLPYDEYYSGLLYFTGSDQFNRHSRILAQEKGFTLSENGLFKRSEKTKKGVKTTLHSEKELFDILGMEYLEPTERDW